MKPALQLKLGQQLTLTPQLRQAIRLLQLSSIELDLEITAALESNPLLERPEDQVDADDGESGPEEIDDRAATEAESADEADYSELEDDWSSDLDMTPSSRRDDGEDGEYQGAAAQAEGLVDHLLWQLGLSTLSPRDRAIGVALIDALEDDGYLRVPIEEVRDAVGLPDPVEDDEIEAVRHLIQHFDPIGVASRDLAECLLIQARTLDADTPGRDLVQRWIDEGLEGIVRQPADRIAQKFGCDVDAVQTALDLLRSLDPKPGSQWSDTPTEYVVPDAIAYKRLGRWEVRLGSGSAPKLGINRHYQSLIGSAGRDDAGYLRGQLQEAKWLIRALETRADTLIRVARYIVDHQSAFLDHGPEAMRPLVLRQVAEDVGLHESTVSRVTTRKYLYTPRGTFEFKYFFSSALSTEGGGEASSTAIQAMIRRLIDAENPHKPYSDARLVDELKNEGVTVARRTVAKYREAMNIPSSSERQRAG
ncbi:MAG: RNA polymerase factor sigma-54 [Xanthomonadales bacterium]|nr:RNA polymerase factor sigma-54 [Xanthomonadales bacterium]